MKSIRYFLLVFILLFSGCNQPRLVFERPGSVDLRSELSAGKTIQLDGLYRFYPGVFLSQNPEATNYIAAPVPGPWDLYSLPGNKRMGPTGFGTFELEVKVPQAKDRLALDVSDIGTAYRLYIDGELVGEKGKAASDPARHRPEVGQEIYHFVSKGPLLDIRLEVSNFSYRKGGIWNPITIGPAGDIVRDDSLDRSIQILLIGILLIMGLYHSGFFLIRKQETSLFFFGVACFLIAVRELTLGPRLLPLLVPYFSWAAYLRLEYICFFLALPTFAYYLWALFPGYFSIMAARFFLFCGVVSTVFVCSSQPLLFSSIIPYFQILSLVFLLYGLGAAIRAALHGHSGARTILVSGGIMGLTVIHDALLLHYVVEGQRMVALGQIQFVVA
ncbi:MAG: 7TM-DISM domain-containing protein, partial [Leptospiraceae bacterium]|nr:7TM-DISM domain-containing protein [Leptospiraceae bacterium]